MKEKNALDGLLRKISDGTATDEEKRLFGQWMLRLDLSPDGMQEALGSDIREAMLEEILAGTQLTKEDADLYLPWYRIPRIRHASWAAAVLVLAVGLLWMLRQTRRSASDPGNLITISNSGRQVRHLRLPDSTEVWLNSGSSLSYYDRAYRVRERRVDLQGEGYFRVSKDVKPFVVDGDGIDTRVLGTAFNVENYPTESEVRVTLVEGKVMVTDDRRPSDKMLLTPDEVLHYSRRRANWALEHTEAKEVIQWIDGHLVFRELPLKEALGRMEKRYGIRFSYDSAMLSDKNVTANFGPRPWQQVLDDLLFVHTLAYHQKNGVIYITKQ